MYRICIITVYFGQLPIYFNQWLTSCGWNPTIDFLIFTDQDIPKLYDNIIVVKTTLSDVKRRFEKALNMPLVLNFSYKLCDYKPMYGLAFHEELDGYDFWGHCDVDLIFGDLTKFITHDVLDRYDKIFPLGHLSLYRNTNKVNNYFRLPGSLRGNFSEVIKTNKICVFDELYGINKIMEYNGLPFYSKEVAADIGFRNQRMIIAGHQNENYKFQTFYIKNGKCFRAFVNMSGEIQHDEFAYIHLQKRHYVNTVDDSTYIIGQNRFYPLYGSITKEAIKETNPCRSKIYERCEYFYKDSKFRIVRRWKQLFIK